MRQIKIKNNFTKYVVEEGEIFVSGGMNGVLDFEFGQFVSREKSWKASTKSFFQ